jgi:arginase family enzyme
MNSNPDNNQSMSVADIKAVFERVEKETSDNVSRRERRMDDILHGDIPTFMEMPLAIKPDQLIGADAAVIGFGFEGLTAKSPSVSAPPTVSRPKPGSVYWRMGADYAPDDIRKYSIFYSRHHNGGWFPEIDPEIRIHDQYKVLDYGNVSVVPADNDETMRRGQEKISDIVAAGALPIVLGGDHTTPIPALRAVAAKRNSPFGVISFDAHMDLFCTEECWASNQWFKGFETGKVHPKNLVIIGIRSNRSTFFETKVADNLNIRYYTINEVKKRGIDEVTREALAIASDGTDGIYTSIDIDVMDPGSVPSQKAPEFWGMTTDEMMHSLQILSREKLAGFDICEHSPDYDVNGQGAQWCARMIVEILGGQAVRKSKGEDK